MTRHAAVVVLSAIVISALICAFGSHAGRSPSKYRCMVLNEDFELVDEVSGTHIGNLNKGAVLYISNPQDLGVTDPGDIELHKLYVKVPIEFDKTMTFLTGSEVSAGRETHPLLRLKRPTRTTSNRATPSDEP